MEDLLTTAVHAGGTVTEPDVALTFMDQDFCHDIDIDTFNSSMYL